MRRSLMASIRNASRAGGWVFHPTQHRRFVPRTRAPLKSSPNPQAAQKHGADTFTYNTSVRISEKLLLDAIVDLLG